MSRRYELINRGEGNYSISSMYRCMNTRRQELAAMTGTEFEASDGAYGYRRIAARLGRRGVSASRDTVRRLMRRAGLVAARPR